MKFFASFLLIFFIGNSFSQTEEELKEIKKADLFFNAGNYGEALRIYLPLLETLDESVITKNELNYKVGFSYYASAPEETFAVSYFQKYLETSENHFEAYYFLGNIFSAAHQFDSAIFYLQKFLTIIEENEQLSAAGLTEQVVEIVNELIEKNEFAKYLLQNPSCAEVESVTGGINSNYSEYAPALSPDETMLVFTRRSPETLGGKISDDGDFFEDIFSSKISSATIPLETDEYGNATGEATRELLMYSMPVNMGQSVNTEGHEGAIQFSTEGNKLYIYRKSNIWVSEKKKKQSEYITRNWKKAKKEKKIKGVFQPKTYEPSVCISPDGNTIYFSSERRGGLGGLDIYKSEKNSDGKWSAPENLGENINTSSDEDAPFISSDGKLLFFSSKGHTNMGDYDIFVSELNGDEWSVPLNMGYPVNSASDDIFFTMTPNGTGFFSSNRTGGLGLMDIYKVAFPANTSPEAVINGTVIANDSAYIPENFTITREDDLFDSKVIFTEPLNGNFSFPLQFGKKYFININDKNCEPFTDTIEVPELLFYCQKHEIFKKIILNCLQPDSVPPPVDSVAFAEKNEKQKLKSNPENIVVKEKPKSDVVMKEKPKSDEAKNLIDPKDVVLFRVQIGAHANPLSKNIYENVANLQVIPFEDGLTRYFSGAFSTYNEAAQRRDEMISNGFEGAFIVAFKNGKRISLSALKSLGQIINKSQKIPTKSAMQNNSEKKTTATNSASAAKQNKNKPLSEKNPTPGQSVRFRVQIGAYKGEVPKDVAEKFSKLGKPDKITTDLGVTIYLSGEFSDFNAAQQHREKIIQQFPNAFVVGEFKGKILTAQEAIELSKSQK